MPANRRQPGNLGPYVDGYIARLLELGYTPHSVRAQLKVVGHLGRWMANEELEAAELQHSVIEAFLAARREEGHLRVPTARSLTSLLDYLRDEAVTGPDEEGPPPTPLGELITQYREWLIVNRALADATVHRYETLARKFLGGRSSAGNELGVKDLDGGAVCEFLLAECARLSVGSAKGRVADLRSLLRFLHLRGLTERSLVGSVPPVAGWHETTVPLGIARTDVEKLLGSCNRSKPAGARDFAILMLLARLGMRSVEVARLQLGDLNWHMGEIIVRGKARREDRLPMGGDVGEALVEYLSLCKRGELRPVFLTIQPPQRPIVPALVGEVVERACRRAGVARVGAHSLRHSLATEMLRQGASLIDISQVLRHQDLATTAVYAKVDIGRLRQVAAPWPGAGR